MSAITLLMALLLLAYVGSFVVKTGGGRFGLASGVEFLALGFVLGPHVLGLLEPTSFDAVEPLSEVAIGWLALVVGLDYGFVGERRVPWKRLVLGVVSTLLVGATVAAAAYVALTALTPMAKLDAVILAGGIGTVSSQTTRSAVRFTLSRLRGEGPLSDLFADVSDGEDIAPVIATALLFTLNPAGLGIHNVGAVAWTGITVALGLLLGGAATLLLGREFRLDETWGVLLGTGIAAVGLAVRTGLSPLATMFAMGMTIAVASRHRADIALTVRPTEHAISLPVLLIAGSRLDLKGATLLPVLLPLAIMGRLIALELFGYGLSAVEKAVKRPALTGPALLSSGGLTLGMGLLFAFHFPGVVGETVLVVAASIAAFGELVGPRALRAVLAEAGELPTPTPLPDVAPPEPKAQETPLPDDLEPREDAS